jgi:O-methyltransferase
MHTNRSERPDAIHITSVVYNWNVGDFFINHSLPSLFLALSQPGVDAGKFCLRIISTDRERLVIVRSDIYRKLEGVLDTEFVADPRLPVDGGKVSPVLLSEIATEATDAARKMSSAIFFLPAYSVISTTSLKFIVDNISDGCRAIFSPRVLIQLDVAKEGMSRDVTVAYTPQNLIDMALVNWQTANSRYDMGAPESAIWKTQVAFFEPDGVTYKLLDTPPIAIFPRLEDVGDGRSLSSFVAKMPKRLFKAVKSAKDLIILEVGVSFDDPQGVTSLPLRTLLRQLITLKLGTDCFCLDSLPLSHVCRNREPASSAGYKRSKNKLWFIRFAALIGSIFMAPASTYVRCMQALARTIGNAGEQVGRFLLTRRPDIEIWHMAENAVGEPVPVMQDESAIRLTDMTTREHQIYSEIATDVCGSQQAVVSLIRGVDYIVANGIAGALVECGVFRGANIVAIIRRLQDHGISDRDIYLYDTFEGMPRPDAVDTYIDGEPAIRVWEARKDAKGFGSDWVRCEIEDVQARIYALGYPKDKLHFVRGMVEETIPGTMPNEISLLRLDTDFYSSTRHELDHMYERLVPKGLLIIDDYGAFAGARRATDEFFDELGQQPFFGRVDSHVRIIVK